jgi:hypothetical protein
MYYLRKYNNNIKQFIYYYFYIILLFVEPVGVMYNNKLRHLHLVVLYSHFQAWYLY